MARAFGGYGERVTDPNEIAGAIKQSQRLNAEGRTVLLDIHTNLEARRSNFA